MDKKVRDAKVKSVMTAYRRMMNDGKSFTWKIFCMNPLSDENYKIYDKGVASRKTDGTFTDAKDFEANFYSVMNDEEVAKVKVVLQMVHKGRGDAEELDFDIEIVKREVYPTVSKPEPMQQPQRPIDNNFSGLYGAINLLGLIPPQGLSGIDPNDQAAQLGAVLQVRDQMNQQRWEERERQKTMGVLENERDALTTRVAELEKELLSKARKCEQLEDALEDAKDQIAELREQINKLNPEANVLGMSLMGLGAGIAQRMLPNALGTIGKVFGLNGLDKVLANAQNEQEQEEYQAQMAAQQMAQMQQMQVQQVQPMPQQATNSEDNEDMEVEEVEE